MIGPPPQRLDLRRVKKIHLVGVGGAGMSAIAAVLAAMGHVVSGSDLKESASLDRLRALGIEVFVGHSASYVQHCDVVGISTAVPAHNVELLAATALGRFVARRSELLSAICSERRTLAVSGTHGKTTTTSMLSLILVEAGWSPSFLIGGDVNEIGTNAVWGAGETLVVEADESDGTFLLLPVAVALVTNVEPDHLDHYGSFGDLKAAFQTFMAGATQGAVVNADDETALSLAPRDATTFGFSPEAQLRIMDFEGTRAHISFRIERNSTTLGRFDLPVPGRHNALNAAGAIAVAFRLGIPLDAAQRALARFAGVARRFEFRGEAAGISFVDDYAHLPSEVKATIAAARQGGWSRVVVVFQPHRYSRVRQLSSDFGDAFAEADLVVITDVYAAGESPMPGVTSRLIVDALVARHPDLPVTFVAQRGELIEHLRSLLHRGDCCLTLGAGDLTSLPDELLSLGPGAFA